MQAICDNLCPECSEGDLDMGESGDGRWPLTWDIIECPTSEIKVSQQGSNACYAKLKFEGGAGAIDGVSCGGEPGEATADGYYVFQDGGCPYCKGLSCEVSYKMGGTKSVEAPGSLMC
jgi:hypothetical protein